MPAAPTHLTAHEPVGWAHLLYAEWSFFTLHFMFFSSSSTANMLTNLPSVIR